MPVNRVCDIAIPCAQVIEPRTLQSMLSLVGYSTQHGVTVNYVGITEREMIDDARNNLTETFLKGNTEWLFWMDSDMVFEPATLVKLFDTAEKTNAKLVTGIYYQRKGVNYPCLWSRGEQTEHGDITGQGNKRGIENKYCGTYLVVSKDKQLPFKAHAAGFGCVLAHRSVFEMMDRPWFKFIKGVCSEDFYFFVNAKDLGIDLWADPTIKLWHLGDSPMIGQDQFYTNAAKINLEIDAIKEN